MGSFKDLVEGKEKKEKGGQIVALLGVDKEECDCEKNKKMNIHPQLSENSIYTHFKVTKTVSQNGKNKHSVVLSNKNGKRAFGHADDNKMAKLKKKYTQIHESTDMTVATTIRDQIKTFDRSALMAWGAKDYVGGKDFLSFRVNGGKHKGFVKIVLNGKDLYDITAYKVRSANMKINAEHKDIPADMLVHTLDNIIG